MTEPLSERRFARRRWLRGSLGLALSGPAWVRATTVPSLRVGFIADYEPFSFIGPDGQLTGFDVEVVKALLQQLGMTFQVQVAPADRLRELARAGRLDVLGNQLLQVQENRVLFDFVRPYASIQLACVQHEDDERDFLSLDDFVGRRLGLLRHSGMEAQAREALGRVVVGYERIEQAMVALSLKQIDAVLEENLIADYLIERHDWPLKVGAPFTAPQKLGLAVVKGRKSLQVSLSDGVRDLLRRSAFRDISARWFGYDVSKPRYSHVTARAL